MSIFFSFITTTIVESQRQGESPNVVVRYPAAPWLLVNIVSGAIVTPLVMAPGYFHHPRRCLCKQQQSRMASPDSLPNRAVHASAKLAIPLSVTGRFIIPLMTLIFASSPTTVMLWQFFPIYVAILFRLRSTILSQLPPTLSAASQGRSKELLFTIPILLSILSYAGPIIYTFPLLLSQHHAEASHLRGPHPRNQFPHHLHHANLPALRRRRYTNRKSSTEMDSRRRTGRRNVLWLDHKGGGYAHADHDGLKNRKREVRRTQG
jgi:hypothetical protein